ncbi:MAG: hypothetical protein ACREJ9_01090 [Candidatus Rokuibacteriota bacterium]
MEQSLFILRAALERLGWAEPDAAAALWSALIGLIITHHAGDGADRE